MISIGSKVRIVGDTVGHGIPIGLTVEVNGVWSGGTITANYNGVQRAVNPDDYVPDNTLDLIANLSAEVARLSKRVNVVEMEYRKLRDKYFSEKLTQIREEKTEPLTREEIVAKAKADVEELAWIKGVGDDRYVNETGMLARAEFIVNREKSTVVVLLRGADKARYNFGIIIGKGKAKASPDDCFNVHIGKAIAVRRALGLEVPKEYLNLPRRYPQ